MKRRHRSRAVAIRIPGARDSIDGILLFPDRSLEDPIADAMDKDDPAAAVLEQRPAEKLQLIRQLLALGNAQPSREGLDVQVNLIGPAGESRPLFGDGLRLRRALSSSFFKDLSAEKSLNELPAT